MDWHQRGQRPRLVGVGVAVAVLTLATPAAGSAASVGSQQKPNFGRAGSDYVDGEVVVTLRPGLGAHATDKLRGYGVQRARKVAHDTVVVDVADGSVPGVIEQMSRSADVVTAEPNYIYRATRTPDDARYGELWGLQKIAAPRAWDASRGSAGVVVAVADTGVQANHPDLSTNLWRNPGGIWGCAKDTVGWNAVNFSCNPADGNDHGTHVAGTIGAAGNNGTGVVGVNWSTAIMSVKMLDDGGSGSASGIVWALDQIVAAKRAGVNVRVVNASWGGGGQSSAMRAAIQRLGDNGILFIAAAGNGGWDALGDEVTRDGTAGPKFYPCSYALANMICVGATSSSDALTSFSNFGSGVDLAAPGQGILSTIPGSTYASFNGTSMATPHVTGAVALVASWSSCVNAPAATLKSHVIGSVDVTNVNVASRGRLNVANALARCGALPPPAPAWSGWQSLGGATRDDPAVVSSAPFILNAFVRGSDNRLYARWRLGTNPWSNYEAITGFTFTGSPSAVSWGTNRIDVFGRSTTNTLLHWYYDGRYWNGANLGGNVQSDVAVHSLGAGHLDLYYRGGDNALKHRWFSTTTGWSGVENLGGNLASSPTVVAWGGPNTTVLWRGADDALRERTFVNGAWQPIRNLGGNIAGRPAAVSWGPGRIDVFARGRDDRLKHWWYTGIWGGVETHPDAVVKSNPSVDSFAAGHFDVYWRSTNNVVQHKGFLGGYGAVESIGGSIDGAPVVLMPGVFNVQVFARATDNALSHNRFPG